MPRVSRPEYIQEQSPESEGLVGKVPEQAPPLAKLGDKLALFLDLDGVLAAIEKHPALVVPTPDRTALLQALSERLNNRLAIISGRPIVEIDRICAATVVAVAGIHGLEMRCPDGSRLDEHPVLSSKVIEKVLAFASTHPSVFVENKSVAIAIHYRNDPALKTQVQKIAFELAADHDLKVQSGHFVEEIRRPGPDKGSALKALMALPPFQGSTPVMIGDDRTDEAGFKAAQSLGGSGIRVAPQVATTAQYSLPKTENVAPWLLAFITGGKLNL